MTMVNAMLRQSVPNEAALAKMLLAQDTFDNSSHGMFRTTKTGQYIKANKALAELYGYESPQALYEALTSIHMQLYVDRCRRDDFTRRIAEHGHVADFEAQIYRADGSIIWICEVAREVLDKNGEFLYYEGSVIDITARKNAEQALLLSVERERVQKRHFEVALENMTQGLCLFGPDARLIVGNHRVAEIFGLPTDFLVPGMTLKEIFDGTSKKIIDWLDSPDGGFTGQSASGEGLDTVPNNEALHAELATLIAGQQSAVRTHELGNGKIITIAHEPTADGGFVHTFTDVTAQRLAETRLVYAASHDALTGLPNRMRFHEQLRDALQQAARGNSCAVLYLDLDQFKLVNDTLGHPIGDGLLKFVANRLKSITRKCDTVARLGGDEFAIIQTDIKNVNDTNHLVDRLLQELAVPHEIDGHNIMSSVSIGIAMVPADGLDADHLLKCADIALYRAKALGRNRCCYFEPGMDALMRERREMEQELSGAITAGEFELHYQPQVDVDRDTVVGFEALLRWRSPRRGLVAPLDFIPLAEETGLIVPIGAWVLQAACREAATWPGDIRVAVNISAVQLAKDDLVKTVRAALHGSGLPAHRLELEITESVMICEDTRVVTTLQALKQLGVTIAMDDFGIGYSSLSYLRRFSFDRIKIDRSFVNGLGSHADGMPIIRAIISLCHGLGITATAEGVETADQLALLRAEHCPEVQGYLISRPQPASEIRRLIGVLPQAG